MKTDLEIAQAATMRPIFEIAEKIGLQADDLIPYGRYIAKVPLNLMSALKEKPDGKLILVSAMTPTPMGEGKTTNTIGLGQALTKIGKKTMIAIREPSLGPCMGVKGGAAGGGYSQVLPMEDINLHFTGDLHAVTIAHNLISACIDNHIHQKNSPEINPRRVIWKRVIDMNDRSLRSILTGLGEEGRNGVMREDGFEITAASEVMAILCLSESIEDLKERIGNITIGYDALGGPVRVRDLGIQGAAAALLKNALYPNLVQTIEGVPVFVHGGPFANIAHGCNTVVATKMALKLADYVVTEAGFGADLGAEKFFNIKCRLAGLVPAATVLVVTNRAYKLHGIENILKHAENIRQFNVPVVVSVNKFLEDPLSDLEDLTKQCQDKGLEAVITDFREAGGEGGLELAEKISKACGKKSGFKPLYELEQGIKEKIEIIATMIYGADKVEYSAEANQKIKQIKNMGLSHLPVCMAKTPASLSDNPHKPGRPVNFNINVSGAKVSSGAGFIVIYTGNVMTMPGLPKEPAALHIDIDRQGTISGLF